MKQRQFFNTIGKQQISDEDLWFFQNVDLKKYQYSIVFNSIRVSCLRNDKREITKDQFMKSFQEGRSWERFVVDSVVEILKDKNKLEVDADLLSIVKEWCKTKIKNLDFKDSIKDIGDNYTYNPIVEYVKEVFLLLDLELEDELLLKMVSSDHESFHAWREDHQRTISSVIIQKIKDKELLRKTVMDNIRSGKLAVFVLGSHFAICRRLAYKECLPDLYNAIISNPSFSDHNRITLAQYYAALGGDLSDFSDMLDKLDERTMKESYSFQWFLIEKLPVTESAKAIKLLLEILNLDFSNEPGAKPRAAQHLIRLSRIEGLEYWGNYTQTKQMTPFELGWEPLQLGISNLPVERAIEILFSVLVSAYKNGFYEKIVMGFSIHEMIFRSLTIISQVEFKHFETVKGRLLSLVNDPVMSFVGESINFQLERLSQRYYASQTLEMDLLTANKTYLKLLSDASKI